MVMMAMTIMMATYLMWEKSKEAHKRSYDLKHLVLTNFDFSATQIDIWSSTNNLNSCPVAKFAQICFETSRPEQFSFQHLKLRLISGQRTA